MTLVTVPIMADYETFSPWDFSPSVTLRTSTQHEVGSKWLKFQSWLDYPCKATLTVIILTLSSVLSRTRGKKSKSWGGREGWEATATNISRSQSILGISSRCQKPTPIRSLHSSRCINSRWDSLIDNYSYLQTSPVTGKQINGRGGGDQGRGGRRSGRQRSVGGLLHFIRRTLKDGAATEWQSPTPGWDLRGMIKATDGGKIGR